MSSPAIQTRITKLFGCKYPIILPGMSWISTPELVAAVSNAGGMGILATGPLTAHETRDAIQRIKSLTNKKFGIGATLVMPGAEENVTVALEEQVAVLNISLGKSDWIAREAHSYGAKILATVTNAKHAESAVSAQADALMITGHEAAAHGGDVTSLVLIPSLSERYPDTPMVAAGGFATGRGLVAALSLGADGVAMGTRFATTVESPLAMNAKNAILQKSETDTIYNANLDGIPARVLSTPLSIQKTANAASVPVVLYRAFQAAKDFNVPLWKIIPGFLRDWNKMYAMAQFGAATLAFKAATVDGDLETNGIQFVGQCQGLIHDVPTVHDLIQRILNEATTVSNEKAKLFHHNR